MMLLLMIITSQCVPFDQLTAISFVALALIEYRSDGN